MRTIRLSQIAVFCLVITPAVIGGISGAVWVAGVLPLGGYEPLVVRCRLGAAGSEFGDHHVPPGFRPCGRCHREKLHWVHGMSFVIMSMSCFFLLVFYPIMRFGLMPVPLIRLFYQALGCHMGTNSYTAGIIYDPPVCADWFQHHDGGGVPVGTAPDEE